VTESANWQFRAVRQFIVVPLVEGENIFGWLAAFNHRRDELFGTVESNLLASLGTLLGIHCGNRDLYRQQSELLQNIVRALVSAIDAKDPYTSGHSDRVARFAVRLALEMKCNTKLINTIYMAGLLHDVGKIGIDDNVLRKAGRLTDIEFEHIKRHPELGHKILADLKQLADVLPAVLHHHERWDGKGYPYGLTADEIPKIARIMAVADSYDAMTSDRPYRSGMPVEKVYQIFRDESGKYWDPEVIEAFFNAKEDIRAISERERAQIDSLQQHLV
jgi:HD-GYP domain-containing protein (c-di-GMP phosphodiesterase class II)